MSERQPIPPEWQAARRVLAIRLDNLGDVLVTSPAIRAIKESLPEAEVTLLASPVGTQPGKLNPFISDVITYQSPQMDPWQQLPQDSEREQRMIATLKERQFDGAIIFTSFRQSSLPQAYMCYLADIPLRLATSIDGPGSLLTTRHKHPEHMMHEVEHGLDLVSAIGLTATKDDLVLQVPDDARNMLDLRFTMYDWWDSNRIRSLAGTQIVHRKSQIVNPLVVMHPGCSMPARTYPWEMFADVADLLVEQLGATVVLTGAPDEQPLVERIRGRMHHDAISAAGTLPFEQFCALIEAADLTVTNNTGPMHISAAVKTPVVALFALTNPPEQWGPWRVPHRQLYHEVPCRLCYKRTCPYNHECLTLVTPEMVVAAAAELLDGTTGDRRPETVGVRATVPVIGLRSSVEVEAKQ